MEELKLLIEMVANLPALAMWVLVGYLVYRLAVIGSIYGVIRLGIEKWHSVLTTRKNEDVRVVVDGLVISDSKNSLIGQLRRIAGKNEGIRSQYIHDYNVEWLREAIDAKELEERKATK